MNILKCIKFLLIKLDNVILKIWITRIILISYIIFAYFKEEVVYYISYPYIKYTSLYVIVLILVFSTLMYKLLFRYEGNFRRGIGYWYSTDNKRHVYICSMVPYKNGKKEGIETQYDCQGKIIGEMSYVNGNRNGIKNKYTKEIVIVSMLILIILSSIFISKKYYSTRYKHGTSCNCDSLSISTYEDGSLFCEVPYKNGKIEGVSFCYWEKRYKNELMSVSRYEQGKKEGLEMHYTPFAKRPILVTNYIKGEKQGIEEYYNALSGKTETPYVKGKQNGIEKSYNEDGSLRRETPYVNGKKNGTEKEYVNGALVGTANYKNGILDGHKHCSDGRVGNEHLYCKYN